MSDESNEAPPVGIPAATVIIFRRAPGGGPPQILMVIRSRSMSFAGGAAVFPGGRVDDADRELAATLGLDDIEEAAHRIAAIRETLEETGLVIGLEGAVDAAAAQRARALLLECDRLDTVMETMGWTLDLSALVPFARWYPRNERLPRVFDTRFYLADLGTGAVEVAVDATENTRLFWSSATDALEAAERGDIAIIYPTRRNLERLAQFEDFAAARAHAETIPVRVITPFLDRSGGEPELCIPEDAGYPVTREKMGSVMRDMPRKD